MPQQTTDYTPPHRPPGPTPGAEAAPGATNKNGRPRPAEPEPASSGPETDPVAELRAAVSALSEVPAYVSQLINAKISGTLYTLRKIALMSVLGVITGLAGISVIVTASALFVIGLSDLIAAFLPDSFRWAGKVLVGVIFVGVGTVLTWIVIKRAALAGREAAAQGYRETLLRQRQQFGVDAMSRAAEREVETGKESKPPTNEDPSNPHKNDKPGGVAGDEDVLNNG